MWLPIVFVGLVRCMVCKEGRRKKQRNLTKQFNKTRTNKETDNIKEPSKNQENKISQLKRALATRQTMTLQYVGHVPDTM